MRPVAIRAIASGAILCSVAFAAGATGKLPVIGGKEAVASVNGEPITVADLLGQVDAFHRGVVEPDAKIRRPDPSALLERIIDARLIVQEARRIGLDQLPETIEQVGRIRMGLLKSAVVDEAVRDVKPPDAALVDRLTKEAVREWRVDSITFESEADAKSFAASVRAGAEFGSLAEKAAGAGKARPGGERSLRSAEVKPEVAAVLSALRPGSVCDPIRLSDGFSVVKLLEIRHPDDPRVRERVRRDAHDAARQRRLQEKLDAWRKQYTAIDRAVFSGLDYESERPGLAALREDARVVARVKGADAVTVKELTEAVERRFYHGVEGAIDRKRVNEDLPHILDRILMERVTLMEAKRLGVERREAFQSSLKELSDGVLFDLFVQKVINPEIRLTEEELRGYYDRHLEEFRTPEMIRLESLAFVRKEDAEAGIGKLRKGADLKWMRANADGQADPKSFGSLLEFDGSLLVTQSLPAGIRNAVAGAGNGEFRYYGEAAGPHYVLRVREVIPGRPQPFERVKSDLAVKRFGARREALIDEWAEKLRGASEVKVFATPAGLAEILGLSAGGTP